MCVCLCQCLCVPVSMSVDVVSVCTALTQECVGMHARECVCRGQRKMGPRAFLLLHCLQMGLSLNQKHFQIEWMPRELSEPTSLYPPPLPLLGYSTYTSDVGAGDSNSGPNVYTASNLNHWFIFLAYSLYFCPIWTPLLSNIAHINSITVRGSWGDILWENVQVLRISNKDLSEIQKGRSEGIDLLKNKIKVKISTRRTGARSSFKQAWSSKDLLSRSRGF